MGRDIEAVRRECRCSGFLPPANGNGLRYGAASKRKETLAVRTLLGVAVACCALFLSGCTGMPSPSTDTTTPDSVKGGPLHGTVYGGRQPIVGARVYLSAANTPGYGQASVPLLV